MTGPVHIVPATLPRTGGSLQPVTVFVGAIVGRDIPVVHTADEVRREHGQIPVRSLARPVHQSYLLIREQLASRDPPRGHLMATARQFCFGIKTPHKAAFSKGVRWQILFRFTPVQAEPARVISPQRARQSSIASVAITTAVEDTTLGQEEDHRPELVIRVR